MDTYAVYAVLDTDLGPHKVRVSEHAEWRLIRHLRAELHFDERGRLRSVMFPGYAVYGRPVRYFAARSTDDPNWPADCPVLSVRSTL